MCSNTYRGHAHSCARRETSVTETFRAILVLPCLYFRLMIIYEIYCAICIVVLYRIIIDRELYCSKTSFYEAMSEETVRDEESLSTGIVSI